MKMLTTQDPETKSADLVTENLDQLKALFPEAFTEGKVDFDVLKQILGGTVDEREEKYGLNWHGKRQARQIALTPSTGKALAPAGDTTVVFRDSAFADDVAKTNMAAILQQHGLPNVRSL